MFRQFYQSVAKPVLFNFDPERVHVSVTGFGEIMGNSEMAKSLIASKYAKKDKVLEQNIAGITFTSPLGLAAGFDYEAKLTQILGPLGFGFQTVGTITNFAYEGNPKPRLKRMVDSKSLLVNKGFKNLGTEMTIKKLANKKFPIPLGISIGRTNCQKISTQKDSVSDIVSSFIKFENSKTNNSYYELNISCPNLYGNVSFYPSKNLHELLNEIDKLHLKKPLFVKMPISEPTANIGKMIEVVTLHCPTGIIIGNLQKDRSLLKPSDATKVEKYKGGISGKPTFDRSNELISLAYRNFGSRLVIIGCGGVFNSDDAFDKISRGASLVQLVTGLIYEGPQLVSEINKGLSEKVKQYRLKDISQARGIFNSTIN